ncbi:MAG TPA: PEP-CTERM sorting domain-containing protein [Planctomycetaceae bacterium]|nr:PEP-CTERM sorting domain-containing protein [Planctomycetaceae bacterium]
MIVCVGLADLPGHPSKTNSVQASVISVPMDLEPGDQYRLVFLTFDRRYADSSNIEVYNGFVSNVAAMSVLGDLNTTWKAIGSTAMVDARTNTGTDPFVSVGVPIYRLDGVRIANNNADLWDGELLAPIITYETGLHPTGSPEVWTGTTVDGAAHVSESLGNASTHRVRIGWSAASGWTWINSGARDYGYLFRFYAISDVLTVVPEPTTAAMLGIGINGVVLIALSRNHVRRRR